MPNFFYHAPDGKIYGPCSEQQVQYWYANGYLSSDFKFQISSSEEYDPESKMFTLGDMIRMHGRILPFFFAPLEDSTTQKNLVEKVESMRKEVESLQMALENHQKEAQSDKTLIVASNSQIGALVESQSELLRRMEELSSRREEPSVSPQLEKKVSELTKKVDEQEKKISSMKKELSTMNSKCDRNDSNLEKLLQKMNGEANRVNGFDKRISDLKASDKTIRDSLSVCQQNVSASSGQLSSIQSELNEIKSAMKKGKEKAADYRVSVEKLKERVDVLFETIEKNAEQLKNIDNTEATVLNGIYEAKKDIEGLKKQVKKLMERIDELEERSEKSSEENENDVQVQPESAFVAPESDPELPPWEKSQEEPSVPTEVDVKMKKDDVKEEEKAENRSPWEDEAIIDTGMRLSKEVFEEKETEDEKENSSPWNDDKIHSGVRESKEVKAESTKGVEKESSSPWDVDKVHCYAQGDCAVKKSEKTIEVKKKESAPWDDIEAKVDDPVEKERFPWEAVESQSALEKTQDEAEPWNQMNGSSKKDAVEAQKGENGLSIEKKRGRTEVAPSKNENAATAKPVSRVKDWNAICNELSDDEETCVPLTQVNVQLARDAENFVRDFIALLRKYCDDLDTFALASMKSDSRLMAAMEAYISSIDPSTAAYGWIRNALKEEMRRLVATPITCCPCSFTITTPRHMLNHFADARHSLNQIGVAEEYRVAFNEISRIVVVVFYRFISSQNEINDSMRRESEMVQRARERVASGKFNLTRLRPTLPFMESFFSRFLMEVSHVRETSSDPSSITSKAIAVKMRNDANNKAQLDTELRAHLEEGIPFCSPCAAAFESVDEYFQHMTSYDHNCIDKSIFSLTVLFFKGRDYWDAML